jgi:hypothetical protein
MDIQYCKHTGLLYVNGVAFTQEMVDRVKSILNKKTEQFEYSVTVKDSVNEAEVTVTPVVMEGINFVLQYHPDGIASDADFEG